MERVKNRKEFLSLLTKSVLLISFFIAEPVRKILGFTKNSKMYFRENPDSVKRQK